MPTPTTTPEAMKEFNVLLDAALEAEYNYGEAASKDAIALCNSTHEALRAHVAKMAEDGARLDWLEQGGRVSIWSDGWSACRIALNGMGVVWGKSAGHKTARAAIDAAREGTP